jgi:hypothetical protein
MAKGQSALEYMMTYGWAILIIVIVAVILYSMGIFNPRASVTASSSGFSPFTVGAALCSGTTTTVSFTTGGLPDSATSAGVLYVELSSPTGFTTTSFPINASNVAHNVTVASGSNFIAKFPVGCTTSGVPFTASGKLVYEVTTSAGPANFTATGTVAGTSS